MDGANCTLAFIPFLLSIGAVPASVFFFIVIIICTYASVLCDKDRWKCWKQIRK